MDRGEIAFFNLGSPPGGSGHEQSGCRPGIIISSDGSDTNNPMVIIIPLTKHINASRFPHTLFIPSSSLNGLAYDSVALTFQMRALDKARYVKPLGSLESHLFQKIESQIRDALSL